ncbi:hypothetical protein H2136_11930 [Aeromonas hydrophila]|uniref:Uncharacterized protein n=1 Tax=Aeromonas hydrophila TaxID=644 RepID=A0A926FP01_AERHY|nr:hypothetical protein [Aeromonas hydrophila]
MSVNIDAMLLKAEQEMRRLQQQAEQEAAMMVALPLRFTQNIEAFRQYIPHIADMYENYCPSRPFKFFVMKMVNQTLNGLMMTSLFMGLTLSYL